MAEWGDFKVKPQEFRPLQTTRLDLKPLVATFDFANELFDIISKNKDFFKFMPWANIETPEQEFEFLTLAEKWWKSQITANYGMYLRSDNSFVGLCAMMNIKWSNETGEVGYWLNPKYARQGYMSEAVNAIVQEFFNMGLKRIYLTADIENTASCKTAEKCGFTREGVMRSAAFSKPMNRRQDMALYAKINTK